MNSAAKRAVPFGTCPENPKAVEQARAMLIPMENMSVPPPKLLGLIEFISDSIEKSGQCTIRDRAILGLLIGETRSDEAKVRRLRLFAQQHDWVVASHLGHAAVFTRRSTMSHAHFITAGHNQGS